MTMPSNISRAEKAIMKMPYGFWIGVRHIAKSARLSIQTMSKYLVQARKRGLVENKRVVVISGRIHLWRRIA